MEEIYFGISAEMLERIEGVNEFIEYIPSEDREMMDRLETSARYCPYCGVKWDGGADNG